MIREWLKEGVLISQNEDTLLLGWGKRRWHDTPPLSETTPQFYFPDFFLKNKYCWFDHPHTVIISVKSLLDALIPIKSKISIQREWKSPSFNFFKETFDHLKQKIISQELIKAVPFVMMKTEGSLDQDTLLNSLCSLLPYIVLYPAFIYGFWDSEEGLLGATPEVLFKLKECNCLETMALAGTKAIDITEEAFLKDPKESDEHQIVVRGITESLASFGKVLCKKTKLLKLSYLEHLMTEIEVKLDSRPSFEKLIQALHPTPALGAFPCNKGKIWLEEYEVKINRMRFGAPVGYYYPNRGISNTYVAIRNMQWNKEQIQIAAGCGIVQSSELDKEFAEINLKLKAIKEMLLL